MKPLPSNAAETEPASDDVTRLKDLEVTVRDSQAEGYDAARLRSRGAYCEMGQIHAVRSALRPTRNGTYLDVGCGTGRATIEIAPFVRAITAVDFSACSIDVLSRRAEELGLSNIRTIVGDISECDYGQETFDGAISVEVIQHLPTHSLRVEALRRIGAVLRPGARLVVVLYRWGGSVDRSSPKEGTQRTGVYRMAFEPNEARLLLEEAGFGNVRVRGVMWLPGWLMGALPRQLRWIESWLSKAPWSARCGEYLLVTGRRA